MRCATVACDEGEMIIMRKLVGRWVLLAVAVPLAVAGVRRLSQAVEARRGPSRATGLLRRSADTVQRMTGRSPKRRRGWGRR
jgi:NADH:ubiquinone oxidoreductase subunit H